MRRRKNPDSAYIALGLLGVMGVILYMATQANSGDDALEVPPPLGPGGTGGFQDQGPSPGGTSIDTTGIQNASGVNYNDFFAEF